MTTPAAPDPDTQAHGAADPRFAPPVADVADVQVTTGLVLGGRWRRFWAVAIDTLLMMVVVLPAAIAIAGSFQALQSPGRGVLLVLAYLVAFAAINGWLLARHGQTVGKRVLGLRIVRRDGSRASLGRILVRRQIPTYIAGMVPLAGPLYGFLDALFIFGASRRTVHDLLADTIVVTAASSA